jgi:hypothetical protein
VSRSQQVRRNDHSGHNRRLAAILGFMAAFLMTIGIAANPAAAAPSQTRQPAASGSVLSALKVSLPTLRFSSSSEVQFRSGVTKLSAGQCSAIRAAMQRAHAAPMAKCEIGIGIVVRPVKSAQASVQGITPASGTWYTYEEQATACWGDNAIWNGPNSSASCHVEGYFGISDEFASNGHWLNLHWENPYHATSLGFSISKTWSGVTGNNTADMVVGQNVNYSAPKGAQAGTAEIRIYNAVCQGYYTCESASAWWQST